MSLYNKGHGDANDLCLHIYLYRIVISDKVMKMTYEKHLWIKRQPALDISRFRGLPVCVPSYAIEAIIWSRGLRIEIIYIYIYIYTYIYIFIYDIYIYIYI